MAQLNRLLERLCDADVDFVVVGGFAAMLHGSTLVTRDLDVCAVLTPESVEKLHNLYLETELGAIDVLSSIRGVGDFARTRAGSIEIELFGRRCRVISIEDLILAKTALGREKDLLAVKELRAIIEKLAGH